MNLQSTDEQYTHVPGRKLKNTSYSIQKVIKNWSVLVEIPCDFFNNFLLLILKYIYEAAV